MNLSSHLTELRKKHQSLSDAIESAQRAPGYDQARLSQLKREKLRLKDEIERLSTS